MSARHSKLPMSYKTMPLSDVPHGRKGKHSEIVNKILADLKQVREGTALKVPLEGLDFSKEKVRSALNRATRKAGKVVATASDDNFLYVWTEKAEEAS